MGQYDGAYKTEGGHWEIPEGILIQQGGRQKTEEVLQHIDRKTSEAGDVDEFDL